MLHLSELFKLVREKIGLKYAGQDPWLSSPGNAWTILFELLGDFELEFTAKISSSYSASFPSACLVCILYIYISYNRSWLISLLSLL